MTMTLYWWYAPLALFMAGCFCIATDDSSGWGIGRGVLIFVFWPAALAMIVGHYL